MIELAENPGRYKELDDHPATGEVPEDYQRVPADKLIDNVPVPLKV